MNNHPSTIQIYTQWRLPLVLLLLSFFLLACGSKGPRKIKNQPPQIFIAGIEIVDKELLFKLQIKNINNIAIPSAQIRFKMFFDEIPVFQDEQMVELSLDGRGTEHVTWQATPEKAAIRRLTELSDGTLSHLEYHSQGEMENMETGKKLSFSKRGSVFAVPGKPGHYRVAGVSDSSRLDRRRVTRPENYQ